jgi:small subunit ribosomal protein S17
MKPRKASDLRELTDEELKSLLKESQETLSNQRFEQAEGSVKSNRRILTGRVSSNKMDKTIVVSIVRQVAHPIYKKYFKRTKKFLAHDPNNECKIGDTVKIRESRPMSAKKRWELIEIVARAK